MKGCLKFNDTVRLVATAPDEYGTEHTVAEANVLAIVEMNTAYSHSANEDNVDSDAVVFFRPDTEFIADNYYRLEEMLVVIQLFGTPESEAWYKITDVTVARDTQLCNNIDHIECLLKKTVESPGNDGS